MITEWEKEVRAVYSWEQLECDLALETWLDLSLANSVCLRLRKLKLHPFDIKMPVKMIVIPCTRDSVLRAIDGVCLLFNVGKP